MGLTSRVQRESDDAALRQADREERVGSLALTVRQPLVVSGSFRKLQVIVADVAESMAKARDVDNSRGW